MKSFKNRIILLGYYYFFWVGYFIFTRIFFLLFYLNKTKELDVVTILKTFLYGLRLDASFAAYLSIIPFLLMVFSVFYSIDKIKKFIKWYTYFLVVFITFLMLIDANLYKAWGVRLDVSILPYLNNPELMLATASVFQLISGLLFCAIISFVFIKIFVKTIHNRKVKITVANKLQALFFIVITAALIIPIRGGFQIIPINQSNVYFSDKMFANHAAINFVWNFFNTLTHKTNGTNPYVSFKDKVAENIINNNRNKLLTANTDSILNTSKPNIILIICEGLTAKVVGAIGGETNVTPNLNSLSKEGILFTNFYANGDRTDKGIPAILSGYYPQPIKRIMRMPNKTRSLPMLPKKLINAGYHTTYYYGGDLNFGNMNTYLRNAGITNFVDGDAFDKKFWNSGWGADDQVVFHRLAEDLSKPQPMPFFKTLLTLTSHQPYLFKGDYIFGKDTEDNKFRSCQAYTDKVLGKFIAFAKTQPWYKNTLIVITADHGHDSPNQREPKVLPIRFQIPMLWLGGALQKTGIKISNVSSQVDFSYTLLDMLNIENSEFTFGKNMFNNNPMQFAHYTFNKGFGTLTKNSLFLYDYVNKKPILEIGKDATKLDSLGKALTQNSYQDFLNRR